jgi:hypothetical protein
MHDALTTELSGAFGTFGLHQRCYIDAGVAMAVERTQFVTLPSRSIDETPVEGCIRAAQKNLPRGVFFARKPPIIGTFAFCAEP